MKAGFLCACCHQDVLSQEVKPILGSDEERELS